VTFTNSFGASDTQTNNVANGQAADFVNLSYLPNIETLVTAGKVPSNWASQESSIAGVNTVKVGSKAAQTVYPTQGMLTDSTVVFIVRKGNPLNIGRNWLNLVKPQKKGQPAIQIVTPNPATSGSARWNLLSAYAAAVDAGYTQAQTTAFLKSIIGLTVAQPTSGSAAMSAFLSGTGNVLLDYEDDAIAAVKAGDPIQIVYPTKSILIENPAALTNTGVNNPGAVAFYKYVFSPAGQTILANLGYRPVLSSVWKASKGSFARYGTPSLNPITTLDPSGWDTLNNSLFGSSGLITGLEQYAGSGA
jgi:sulfate transport system substrate-binding protein